MDDPLSSLALTENSALKQEIARLREENQDLHCAAGWWIFLYESALLRANFYEAQLSSVGGGARVHRKSVGRAGKSPKGSRRSAISKGE
jgi:hypothetical protein